MSELAYNINGETFDVPATATGWRVRRMKPRGAPEVVFGRDGLPLVVPIDADLDELRDSVGAPGRFRLDAANERGRNIADVPASYVVVPNREEPAPPAELVPVAPSLNRTDSVVAEAMRLNTELAKSVIDRFPEMMQAAAELLRAADGAGLPARKPREIEYDDRDDQEDDDDDEDEIAAPPGFDLNALVAQLVPTLMAALMSGKAKVPSLGALFDWRKASPKNTDSAPAASVEPHGAGEPAASTKPNISSLPPLDPKTMVHFIAIQQSLTPQEGQLAREIAADLSPIELRAWFDELSKLSVADAAEKIRGLVGGAAAKKAGGAS